MAKAVSVELGDRHIAPAGKSPSLPSATLFTRVRWGSMFTGCANPPRENPGIADECHHIRSPLYHLLKRTLSRWRWARRPQTRRPHRTATSANASVRIMSDQSSRADSAAHASTGPRQLDYLRPPGHGTLSPCTEGGCPEQGADLPVE